MKIYLFIKVYECLTVFLPCLAVYLAVTGANRRQGNPPPPGYALAAGALAAYLFAVFLLTGSGTLSDLLRYGEQLYSGQINLSPFASGLDPSVCRHYFNNILLFMPLGFLLPLLWPRSGGWGRALLYGFFFSLFIEISQLVSHRATDVDDLIMNTAGALLGCLACRVFLRLIRRETARDSRPYEPLLYIGAMSLGHFLLYNESAAAKILSAL